MNNFIFYRSRLLSMLSGFSLSLCIVAASPANAAVSQTPLIIGGGDVPGNLALVPSVEYPTVISVANTGAYLPASTYVGYFNAAKCYTYNQGQEYFEPTRNASNHTCGGSKEWSGNFLNWAATPTIDPFRSALTGGYRSVDTSSSTVLQKARHGGEDTFGNRMNSGQGIVSAGDIQGATPASSSWGAFNIRLQGMGNEMLFSNWIDGIGGGGSSGEKTQEWVYYEPNNSSQWEGNGRLKTAYTPSNQVKSVYRVKVRVKVCVSGHLESNCELYPAGNYKPVGLLQQYSNTLRYSVFGYLNDSDVLRDGGVLRAQQKFIGPSTAEAGRAEWDAQNGVMVQNPDSVNTSLGRTIADSGVMNYLNKFGELNAYTHKSIDPVSELFYTSLRYFKNQGNVEAYSTASPGHNSSPNNATKDRWHDGFPVITNWNDPIEFACQRNVILGIGDVNTHRDKNLPGNSNNSEEPSKPTEVQNDDTINVVTATNKVAALEGITINTPFTGRNNSAYIAGLAYDANTRDLRDDLAGDQTVSTYWVDVRENQVLASRSGNQYWLAAKYGGFKVPEGFGDPYVRTEALADDWWWTSGDYLQPGYKRPDNFFLASDATRMVEGLKQAFAQIANEVESTTTSVAVNSSRLETDTAVFQTRLDSRFWAGNLLARAVDGAGGVAGEEIWNAAAKLDARNGVGNRNILTVSPGTATGNNPVVSSVGIPFKWADLPAAQRQLLRRSSEINNTLAQARVNYLRGNRSQEISADDRTLPFRQRGSRLGDIVNSDPQYVDKLDYGYARLNWANGGTTVGNAYSVFRSTPAYKGRVPMILVGGNDGMLHGFDATPTSAGGAELFAYVPNGVFDHLIDLTDPNYTHRYYVDGTPRVSDVWLGNRWGTMVVGSTGAGGRSVFALDITNVQTSSDVSTNNVMWEFTHPKMGYTTGQPALVALPNEKFGVIVSSGFHDTAPTEGYVWILDAETGSLIKQFQVASTGNLGAPLASDTDYDQVADRIYVPDTLGNVWRFDLNGSNASAWSAPASLGSAPLFVAKDADGVRQPITAPLSSAFNDKNQHIVLFGTGSFQMVGDNEVPIDPQVQSFYSVIDGGLPIDGRSGLLQQEIIYEQNQSGQRLRAVSDNAMTSAQKGWFIDLAYTGSGGQGPEGERVVAKAALRSGRVIFTTMIPSEDPCASGGTSFIMALDINSGSRLRYVFFDTNGDGVLDEEDTYVADENGDGIPWSGISNEEDGTTKGVTPLYKWLCYAGSGGGAPKCIPVPGSQREGRNSWREVREE